MNLIIPMAGKGTRLRPLTLTTLKPLIEIAGKTIIQRIVELVKQKSPIKITNIGFIIEGPNIDIEKKLSQISKKNSINHKVFYQGKPKGTAHAIYCAKELLTGPTLIVFADTLFETNLNFPKTSDGCIFVTEVDDPSAYGVVKTNNSGEITAFIEKPQKKISNLAIVGIYYFKDGVKLISPIKKILEEKTIIKGEYQITTVLEHLKVQGFKFFPHKIKNWFDFGTPNNLLESHAKILNQEITQTKTFVNTTIIEPCYIASDVEIVNSTIGPHVSIAEGSTIKDSKIKNTIIQSNSKINGAEFKNSIIGKHVEYNKDFTELNIGDYAKFK